MARPAIIYTTRKTKPLSEIRASDVPRGLSPDDVALDDKTKKRRKAQKKA